MVNYPWAKLSLDYPIYGSKFLNDDTLLVTGGGGEADNSVPNKLTAVTIDFTRRKIIKRFRELSLAEDEDAPTCIDTNGSVILLSCNQNSFAIKNGQNQHLRKYGYIKEHLRFLQSAQISESINPLEYIKSCCVSPDGSIGCLSTSTDEADIFVVDTSNLEVKFHINTKTTVKDLCVSPDGKIISYATPSSIEFISTVTGNLIASKNLQDYLVSKIKFNNDNTIIIVATQKKVSGIFLLEFSISKNSLTRNKLINNKIKSITAMSYHNGLIALSGNDASILLIKESNFKVLKIFPKVHGFAITSIQISPNNQYLSSTSADNTINVFKLPPNLANHTPFIVLLFKRLMGLIAIILLAIFLQFLIKHDAFTKVYSYCSKHYSLDSSSYFTIQPVKESEVFNSGTPLTTTYIPQSHEEATTLIQSIVKPTEILSEVMSSTLTTEREISKILQEESLEKTEFSTPTIVSPKASTTSIVEKSTEDNENASSIASHIQIETSLSSLVEPSTTSAGVQQQDEKPEMLNERDVNSHSSVTQSVETTHTIKNSVQSTSEVSTEAVTTTFSLNISEEIPEAINNGDNKTRIDEENLKTHQLQQIAEDVIIEDFNATKTAISSSADSTTESQTLFTSSKLETSSNVMDLPTTLSSLDSPAKASLEGKILEIVSSASTSGIPAKSEAVKKSEISEASDFALSQKTTLTATSKEVTKTDTLGPDDASKAALTERSSAPAFTISSGPTSTAVFATSSSTFFSVVKDSISETSEAVETTELKESSLADTATATLPISVFSFEKMNNLEELTSLEVPVERSSSTVSTPEVSKSIVSVITSKTLNTPDSPIVQSSSILASSDSQESSILSTQTSSSSSAISSVTKEILLSTSEANLEASEISQSSHPITATQPESTVSVDSHPESVVSNTFVDAAKVSYSKETGIPETNGVSSVSTDGETSSAGVVPEATQSSINEPSVISTASPSEVVSETSGDKQEIVSKTVYDGSETQKDASSVSSVSQSSTTYLKDEL